MGGIVIRLIFEVCLRRLVERTLTLALAAAIPASLSAAEDCLKSVNTAAVEVQRALFAEDGAALAALVHEEFGVRISTSVFVIDEDEVEDPKEQDRVLDRASVRALWTDRAIYYWGYDEGSEEAIELTGADLVSKNITNSNYNLESAEPVEHAPGVPRTSSNDNAAEKYSEAEIVDFISKDPSGKMPDEWYVLRLAFVRDNDACQQLVGLIIAANR